MTRTDPVPPPEQPTPAELRLRDALASVRGWREPKTILGMLDAALAEARAAELRAVLTKLHWGDQWQEGGNHPNTPDIDDCGACRPFLDAVATERSDGR